MIPVTSLITTSVSTTRTESESGSRTSGRTGSRATWEKADRLLLEGRLRLVSVDGNEIKAQCLGDSAVIYHLEHFHGRWSCTCPARVDCSHLRALQRVVVVER